MKKTVLAMLLCGLAASASAQAVSDFLTISYHDQEIKDGDTVYITERIDEGDDLGFTYISHMNVENKTTNPVACFAVFQYYQPSMSEVRADDLYWGSPSMCYAGAITPGQPGTINSCLAAGAMDAGRGTVWVPAKGEGNFSWEPHLDFANGAAVSTYKLVIVAAADTEGLDNGEPMTINVCYCEKAPSAVNTINIDNNTEAVYYDLQGRKIANPLKGLYIRVADGKAAKVIL